MRDLQQLARRHPEVAVATLEHWRDLLRDVIRICGTLAALALG